MIEPAQSGCPTCNDTLPYSQMTHSYYTSKKLTSATILSFVRYTNTSLEIQITILVIGAYNLFVLILYIYTNFIKKSNLRKRNSEKEIHVSLQSKEPK